jgi:DGQHR domain-containing protein
MNPNLITRAAAKIQQSGLTIYSTSLYVSDLLKPDFFQIERLDSSNSSKGYQRILDETRKRKLADYLKEAWKEGDAFLPTSIFLATDKNIPFDLTNNTITFDIRDVGPFSVVDGQHRVAVLVQAAKEIPELEGFQISANIAINLDEVSQMCHFLIVNSTQRSVDTAITQQIHSRLTEMVSFEEIPTLPKWIKRQVLKGEDRDALIITEYLNSETESPWHGKIQMANESGNKSTIKQHSFVNSIKKYILSSNNPLMSTDDVNKRNKILLNYWKAINNIYNQNGELGDSALFKTIGIELFHQISPAVFSQLFLNKDFKVPAVESLLKKSFEKLDSEHVKVGLPHFWKKGNDASGLNQAAVRKYASELNKAILYSKDEISDIEI